VRRADFTTGPWPYLLLALVLAAVFANGLWGGFLWDDQATVVDNVRTHGLSHVPELLGWGEGRFRYRVMRDLSYTIDYAVGGLNPAVYHFFNVLYHALTSFLVFALARRLTGSGAAALWAGLLFAVHPVHVDAVTYISGRRDVLSTLFYLASVWGWLNYRERGTGPWLALAFGVGALAVLTKEMAATLPAAWFLVDLWRERERGLGVVAGAAAALSRHWRLYGAGAVAAAGFIGYVVVFQNTAAGVPPHGGSWPANFMTEAMVMAYGVRLFLFPQPLLLDYQGYFDPVTSGADPRLWAALVALALLAALGGWLAARSRSAGFAVHWVWITWLPVAQIIPHLELFAEHYLYLPSVGLCILGGMGLAALGRLRIGGAAALAVGMSVVALLGVRTWDRNRDFADPVTVFEAQYRVHPEGIRSGNNLALAYQEAGRLAEARDAWLRYLKARSADVKAWEALGTVLRGLKDGPGAVTAYRRAVELDDKEVGAWVGLGIAFQMVGDPGRAEAAFRRVLALDPEDGDAWNNLGVLSMMRGAVAEAEAAFSRAIDAPRPPGDAYLNLARVRISQGRCGLAAGLLRDALARGVVHADSPYLARIRGQLAGACGGGG